jgi:hypothetical protein
MSAVVRLLAQRNVARLESARGESAEIQALLAEIETALKLLDASAAAAKEE